MIIFLNGDKIEVKNNINIEELLQNFNIKKEDIVVEKNMEIIDKNKYSEEKIKENDKIEIISFMGGG